MAPEKCHVLGSRVWKDSYFKSISGNKRTWRVNKKNLEDEGNEKKRDPQKRNHNRGGSALSGMEGSNKGGRTRHKNNAEGPRPTNMGKSTGKTELQIKKGVSDLKPRVRSHETTAGE